MMKKSKWAKLRKAGWKVGSAKDFLGLSDEESTLIEMKLALADNLRKRRLRHRLTQGELAHRLGSSQSRVAKMEHADGTVSIDLLIKAILTLGATRQELGRLIGRKTTSPAA
jgi:DNA-binding XRE family transcriptional regulator